MKTTQTEKAVSSSKDSYEKPMVTTFGSVAKLTQGVGGSKTDNGQAANTRRGGV